MKKPPRKSPIKRMARQFAHNLERSINRLGKRPAPPPQNVVSIRKQQPDNPPPDSAA